MAVGARITSTNLSGKTATVTFIPYTGSTSGSTVNLGTKTIPFNNINTHPYGVYNLYFAEYDYTYTFNIPEPDASVQSFAYLNRMVGSDNYGVAFLNFDDLTAEIIDLGVRHNIVDKAGAWYSYNGDRIGQGKDNVREYLKQNPEMAIDIENRVREIVGVRLATAPASEKAKGSEKK